MLTNSDLEVETMNPFFAVARNETDFSFIPSVATPEHASLRRGLLMLAHRFGFTLLTAELEKYISRSDLLVLWLLNQAVLSDDFLNSYDARELSDIVKYALDEPHIRLQSDLPSHLLTCFFLVCGKIHHMPLFSSI
jgi:hypothetical protein